MLDITRVEMSKEKVRFGSVTKNNIMNLNITPILIDAGYQPLWNLSKQV